MVGMFTGNQSNFGKLIVSQRLSLSNKWRKFAEQERVVATLATEIPKEN